MISHRYRYADLRRAPRLHSVKSRGTDADNGQRTAIDDDFLADNTRIRPKTSAPITMTEHGQRMPTLNEIVGRSEHASHSRSDPENRKVIPRNKIGADEFRTALERSAHRARVRAEHSTEDLVLVPDFLIH